MHPQYEYYGNTFVRVQPLQYVWETTSHKLDHGSWTLLAPDKTI